MTLPALACDCHVHVIGDALVFPMVVERHYTPGLATTESLQHHLAGNEFSRAVIVQPSVYGFDNRCLLDALATMRGAARGVAVLLDDVNDSELRALDAAGVRGVRLNVESAAERDSQALQQRLAQWAARLAPLGWHIQIYAALDVLADIADSLHKLAARVVLDHFAMMGGAISLDDARVQKIMAALARGNVYLKLSAPYRVSDGSAKQDDALSILAAHMLERYPAQLLWGSDWPHTNRETGKTALQVSAYRKISKAQLQNGIARWLPSEQARQQVLVDNPARLYRF